MPNAWVSWVKKWSKDHNISYGCAISDIDCVAEYRLQKEDTKNKQAKKKTLKKLIPPPQAMEMGMPNLEPIKKNIVIKKPEPFYDPIAEQLKKNQGKKKSNYNEIEDMFAMEKSMMNQPSQKIPKRGRPTKYLTEKEKYDAKLLSNKLKRREKSKTKSSKKITII